MSTYGSIDWYVRGENYGISGRGIDSMPQSVCPRMTESGYLSALWDWHCGYWDTF